MRQKYISVGPKRPKKDSRIQINPILEEKLYKKKGCC